MNKTTGGFGMKGTISQLPSDGLSSNLNMGVYTGPTGAYSNNNVAVSNANYTTPNDKVSDYG